MDFWFEFIALSHKLNNMRKFARHNHVFDHKFVYRPIVTRKNPRGFHKVFIDHVDHRGEGQVRSDSGSEIKQLLEMYMYEIPLLIRATRIINNYTHSHTNGYSNV